MQISSKKDELATFLKPFRYASKSIGFVPTMGALHEGHLSLIRQATQENEQTVVSIFINPTQFDNLDDLTKYPRTLDADIVQIKSVSPNAIIYAPTVADIYENQVTSKNFSFDGLEHQMEGKYRSGHFNGVGTIVKKLFKIVQPTNAYFGEKDFQQLQIIKKLVSKYQIPVLITGCPIYREPNGLAMSSRNARLSENARNKAAIIYKTLQKAKQHFQSHSATQTIQMVEKEFLKYSEFQLEYFEIANENTLLPCKRKVSTHAYRGFIAVFVEEIRLIDNLQF